MAVLSSTTASCVATRCRSRLLYLLRSSSIRRFSTRYASSASSSTTASTTTVGYQSIGSFHSENVEHLMALSDQDYIPPSLPFTESISFSQQQKQHHQRPSQTQCSSSHDFLLDRSQWTFLNHGAFGAALRAGYDRAQAWRYYMEQQPLRYFDRDLLPHLVYTTRRLSTLMKAPPIFMNSDNNHDDDVDDHHHHPNNNGVALLPNVTSGLSAILRNHAINFPDAKIVLWDCTYGSVKKMAKTFHSDARIVEIPLLEHYLSSISLSSSLQHVDHQDAEQVVVHALQETLDTQQVPPHSLLILDQTTSNTAINMPLIKLARVARELDPTMMVIVDGAHGLLAQDVNLQQLTTGDTQESPPTTTTTTSTPDHSTISSLSSTTAPPPPSYSTSAPLIDIYLSNGHKWLSCPRGVAVLYASSRDIQNSLLRIPAVVSHGVDDGFLSRFLWDGCRDYAAALAVPAVLDYWQHQYPDLAIDLHPHLRQGLIDGIQCLLETWYAGGSIPPSSEWHLHHLTLVPMSLCGPTMALVRLPLERMMKGTSPMMVVPSLVATSAHAKQIQDYIYHHHIEVPIKCVNGKLYVRVSNHIYNTTSDFERLAQQLLQFPTSSLN